VQIGVKTRLYLEGLKRCENDSPNRAEESPETLERWDYHFHRLEAIKKQRQQARVVKTGHIPTNEDSSGSSVATVIYGDEGIYVRNDAEDPTSLTLFHDWVCGLRNSDKKDLPRADAL
jgi:hypothetical protein